MTTTARTPLIISSLTVTYPDGDSTLTVLDSVDFAPQRSQLTAITGASGSGKSTLLTTAALLTAPTGGSIEIAGQKAWELNPEERTSLRRNTLGLVFQQPNLFASLTAKEQLLLTSTIRRNDSPSRTLLWNRKARRNDTAAASARADEMLELVGLQDKAHLYPHQLSGGQRQRINIARALMNSPQVVLADEPTSALDEDTSAEVMDLLRRVTQSLDVATVVVTHDKSALEWCQSVYELRRGHLTELAGTPA